ncbi:MAG TPA: cob(I)yrinic acid a,c-diamide adenosyltransferase [Anaeromyxobacteraceae bacterium]|nr:cob(I)yrinic acid a,c-diamide adenosyltransferase [Anaeromyxobacteraceae bacterium]
MKIYTKTGDRGETSLLGGARVGKDDPRVEAYGTVDELNAALGAARAFGPDPDVDGHLARLQERLFTVGAELAAPVDGPARRVPRVEAAWAEDLERAIDLWERELAPLSSFVLPGGTHLAATLHVARAVGRRAERRVVALSHAVPVDPAIVAFLNRVSDFLFVAARVSNHRAGVADVAWRPEAPPEKK